MKAQGTCPHLWLASGTCLIKICVSLWQTYHGQCQHTLVLLSRDLKMSLLRWRAGILQLHLPDWAKLLGLYTLDKDSLPFDSPITHFYIENIKHLWYQQPWFSCTLLLYNSISCYIFIYILYWTGIWEDGCYSKLHKGSFQSSLYQISLVFPCYMAFFL